MVINILMIIRFNGENYHGWQKQNFFSTLQNIIEITISSIINKKIKLIGCGRTDSKVNANIYICNFQCDDFKIPIEKFNYILNRYLINDIKVLHVEYINKTFHSQFSCKKKEYTYVINNNKINDPFLYNKCYFYPQKLNINNMKIACKFLIGKHDFTNFCNPKCYLNNKIRIIYYINIISTNDNFLFIKVCSNGFLHNMVRIISYELLKIGIGKINNIEINNKLISKEKIKNDFNMLPPHGLFLSKLWYKNFSVTI